MRIRSQALSAGLFSLLFLWGLNTQAGGLTHTGLVKIDLESVSAKGTVEVLAHLSGDFKLDWSTGKCEVKLGNSFAYCHLDVSTDLKDKKGQTLVRMMPKAHFDAEVLRGVWILSSLESPSLRSKVETALDQSKNVTALGIDLPFYTCESCEPVKGKTPLWNAFQGHTNAVSELVAQKGQDPLRLKFTLQNLKPSKEVFQKKP